MTRSVFRTHKTDRGSLSCIVMQPSKNDSGAFFWFSLVFTYNGSYGKWIGFSGRFDRICRWV
ncbi:TPA: hypothetical protein ACNSNC_004965 [Escherichia coli]